MLQRIRTFAVSSLRWVQFLALLAIPFITPHSYRAVLWEQPVPAQEIYIEFRGIVLFLPHYALALLVLATLLRLTLDGEFRGTLAHVIRTAALRYGGVFWLALSGWMALSVFWAPSPLLVLYQVQHWLLALFMAVVLATLVWQSSQRERWLLLGFGLAALLHALLALAQSIKGTAIGLTELGELVWPADNLFNFGAGQLFRAYALTVHPNNLAGYLMLALFALLMLVHHQQRKGHRIWWLLPPFMIVLAGLLSTISRTVIAAAVLTLPLALLKLVNLRRIPRQRSVVIGVLLLVGIALGLLAVTDIEAGVLARFQRLLSNPEGALDRVFFEFDDTTPIIQQTHPRGTGMGNLMIAIGQRRAGADELLLPAHNAYWIIWAELGVPGVTLYLLACISVVLRIRPANNAGLVIWGSAFLAVCLANLFDYYFWGDLRSHTMVFWLLGMWWGYAAAQERYTPV